MRVEKSTVVTYEVNLENARKTPMAIARAINELADAGVDVTGAEFEDGQYNKFSLVVRDVLYYDDSTIDRMEPKSPRYEVGIKIDNVNTREQMADEVTKRLKKRESLDPRY